MRFHSSRSFERSQVVICRNVAQKLSKIKLTAPSAVPELVEALSDEDTQQFLKSLSFQIFSLLSCSLFQLLSYAKMVYLNWVCITLSFLTVENITLQILSGDCIKNRFFFLSQIT